MENIKYFGRAFAAECVKIKNTLGLWSAFLFPLLIVFMNFMIFMSRPQMMAKAQGNLWYNYTNNSLMMWTIIFMPLFIGIITFYITSIRTTYGGTSIHCPCRSSVFSPQNFS